MSEYKELSCLAYDLRKKVVEMVVSGKGGHIGGDMSVIDAIAAKVPTQGLKLFDSCHFYSPRR